MKHRCGTRGAAPASDAVGRSDALGMPLPTRPAASRRHATWIPRVFSRLGPIWAESGRLGPESAVSAETDDSSQNSKKKKKKKGAERTI